MVSLLWHLKLNPLTRTQRISSIRTFVSFGITTTCDRKPYKIVGSDPLIRGCNPSSQPLSPNRNPEPETPHRNPKL